MYHILMPSCLADEVKLVGWASALISLPLGDCKLLAFSNFGEASLHAKVAASGQASPNLPPETHVSSINKTKKTLLIFLPPPN